MSVPRLRMETGTREDDVRDDRPTGKRTGGLLRGWRKHLHGYACPRCGVTCHDRMMRTVHDSDHRQRDQWDEDWQELIESQEARLVKLEGQMELMTELLGPSLARLMEEREPA